jgi:hypothetical protein
MLTVAFNTYNRLSKNVYDKGNKYMYRLMKNIIDDPITKLKREHRISTLKQEIREVKWLFKNNRHDEFNKFNPIGCLQGMEAALSDLEAINNRDKF